jgi:octaprenyl-diphosphate synthase
MQSAAANITPLHTLANVSAHDGPADLSAKLRSLDEWLKSDIAWIGNELAQLQKPNARMVQTAAVDLVASRGKYLRPICVALASRIGAGFGPQARQLAVAVEMVHNATLLHDDVVDLADQRRGKPAARTIYGNAASIFAGDWLLVNALMKVQQTEVSGALAALLAVIEEMVLAESLQLERRGKIDDEATSMESYLAVARGKTAALFRWAMFAGARAGQVGVEAEQALESFGLHLGVAFQVIDDCLDFTGSDAHIGKTPLADLREGKITYPLVLALRKNADLMPALRGFLAQNDSDLSEPLVRQIANTVRASGAIEQTMSFARQQIETAVSGLSCIAESEAKEQLRTVAFASLARTR